MVFLDDGYGQHDTDGIPSLRSEVRALYYPPFRPHKTKTCQSANS
jgi:hypothetical protein